MEGDGEVPSFSDEVERKLEEYIRSEGLTVERRVFNLALKEAFNLLNPDRFLAEMIVGFAVPTNVDCKSATAENANTGNGSISHGCLNYAWVNQATPTVFVHPAPGLVEIPDDLITDWRWGTREDVLAAKAFHCCRKCELRVLNHEEPLLLCPHRGDSPFLVYHLDRVKPISSLFYPNGQPPSE